MKIYLATNNKGKIREINSLFKDTGIEFIGGVDLSSVVEDGNGYRENALIKALFVYKLSGTYVVSEDSGLEVDALQGAPGVHSARYADLLKANNATDNDNIAKLLSALKDVPKDKRTAKYVSAFCFIDGGAESFFMGEVHGKIIDSPRGNRGFGYDPVFVPDGYDKTFAELGGEVKNKISHRAVASAKLRDFLVDKFVRSNG
ncbi:MAG: RdgB/HAM1 family non-canonical purine NTP pyrophosphatase [Nitrospirae bacterium]|nr:RdgB/HAM1 family non-canonical purine NTP pyrophosphatase [Nitrospirota bacterium]MBF0535856.1 RdgB/HAM1 family non-canonical purine NTP pyrophosphatase [Nitrospirota bacterium]MBF0617810.1 RdgB/HAM1 family non-canonical purine NTP pyrophosphatase [Nitrospirota bacterium]